jgi:hypothetical protein
MTTGKSLLTALAITLGTAAAAMSVDVIWMMKQSARGVPGETQTINLVAVFSDIFSVKGSMIGAVIFLFVFAVAKSWQTQLRG